MESDTDGKAMTLEERAKFVKYIPPLPKYHPDLGRDYMGFLMDPQKTALLNVDIQNIFTERGAPIAAPDGPNIVKKVNQLVKYCRGHAVPVIWIKWVSRRDGSNLGMYRRYWQHHAKITEDMSLDDSHWSQLYAELDVQPDDIIVKKPKYNAFWGSDLEAVLRSLGIESLLFTGIATDVCVQMTLVDAFHRDFSPIIVEDATATPFPYYEQTLKQIEWLYGRVLTVDEVINELRALSSHASKGH